MGKSQRDWRRASSGIDNTYWNASSSWSIGADGRNKQENAIGERSSGDARPHREPSSAVPGRTRRGYRYAAAAKLRRDSASDYYLLNGIVSFHMPGAKSVLAAVHENVLKGNVAVRTQLKVLTQEIIDAWSDCIEHSQNAGTA